MVYNKIVKLCKVKNISICKLEKECGLGNGTISYWKKKAPTLTSLEKVANYFEIPIDYLLKK